MLCYTDRLSLIIKELQNVNKKSIDAKHQRATPKEFDPDLHLNT
jgi:hypothetical protein